MKKETHTSDSLEREALIFGRYLLEQDPTEKVVELYKRAITGTPVSPSSEDKKLLEFVVQNPWSVGFIDGGLALLRTDSDIRRRIYTMLAITEAMPEYHDYYLPKKRSGWYLLVIALVGIRGAIRTIFGAVLVKAIG